VDKEFLDQALTRLFALPSRIASDEWKSIASTVGATVRPEEEASASTAAAPPAPASASGGSALDALMAKMSSVDKQVKEAAATKAPAAPRYCPVYDWKKALALVTEGADSAPGAHRRKLEISFGSLQAKVEKTYTPINAAELDALRETLHEKPISLSITQLRDSSTNPSVFAPGTDRKDYSAYGVATVDAPTRTRIAIVVRADTDVSRRMSRVQASDKLNVRGTAYHTSGQSGLSILVDSFDLLDA
jgi:hypothetical protein